jgi:hypothetical protein
MGHKQGDKGKGAIGTVKTVGGFYMMFKGTVEAFDKLLVGRNSWDSLSRFWSPMTLRCCREGFSDLSALRKWIPAG